MRAPPDPVRLQVDAGAEYLVPWARSKLRWLATWVTRNPFLPRKQEYAGPAGERVEIDVGPPPRIKITGALAALGWLVEGNRGGILSTSATLLRYLNTESVAQQQTVFDTPTDAGTHWRTYDHYDDDTEIFGINARFGVGNGLRLRFLSTYRVGGTIDAALPDGSAFPNIIVTRPTFLIRKNGNRVVVILNNAFLFNGAGPYGSGPAALRFDLSPTKAKDGTVDLHAVRTALGTGARGATIASLDKDLVNVVWAELETTGVGPFTFTVRQLVVDVDKATLEATAIAAITGLVNVEEPAGIGNNDRVLLEHVYSDAAGKPWTVVYKARGRPGVNAVPTDHWRTMQLYRGATLVKTFGVEGSSQTNNARRVAISTAGDGLFAFWRVTETTRLFTDNPSDIHSQYWVPVDGSRLWTLVIARDKTVVFERQIEISDVYFTTGIFDSAGTALLVPSLSSRTGWAVIDGTAGWSYNEVRAANDNPALEGKPPIAYSTENIRDTGMVDVDSIPDKAGVFRWIVRPPIPADNFFPRAAWVGPYDVARVKKDKEGVWRLTRSRLGPGRGSLVRTFNRPDVIDRPVGFQD